MSCCSVPRCSDRGGGHRFPTDPNRRKEWIVAIKRDKWEPTKYSIVCKQHFKPSDYLNSDTTYDGLPRSSKRSHLKSDAVPSIFDWKPQKRKNDDRDERAAKRVLRFEQEPNIQDVPQMEIDISSEQNVSDMVCLLPDPLTLDVKCQTAAISTISIERLMHDDKILHMYTGLESYEKFVYVFATLGPAAYELNYRWSQHQTLSPENQFLLTCVKLRQHKINAELAFLFGIGEFSVSNIFVTWLNFMYHQWQEIDTWPSQDLVRFYIPRDFKRLYPKTRIILDGMEFPVQKPKLPSAQQATYSTYKNRNTLKTIVGATPGGLVTHNPPAYGGSASDRALIERSDLPEKMDPNDDGMTDKGFIVQDIFAPYDIRINMPHMLKKRNQFSASMLIQDRQVASKRVHIERIIGLAKTYKILTQPLNQQETQLGSEIAFVCFAMCNFRTRIVPQSA